MHSYRSGMCDRERSKRARREREAANRNGKARAHAGGRLRAVAAVLLTLTAGMPPGFAQQTGAGSNGPDKAASELPAAPAPAPTQPYPLRTSSRDFSKPFAGWLGNPINIYRPTTIGKASFTNSVRLADLVKDGKIYLSLSDAIALAIENNYDIAIARYDLDIADTDILRTKTGAGAAGRALGPGDGHAGRIDFNVVHRRRAGRHDGWLRRRGFRRFRPHADHGRRRPHSGGLRSIRHGTIQLERAYHAAVERAFFRRHDYADTNTDEYNFTFNQGIRYRREPCRSGFRTSASPPTIHSPTYSPYLQSIFKATLTQHLLQGAGIWVNKRFIYQALNDRRITDSSFRQQILYTVNQVENIYWGLVQAYEDVQAKERALEQSQQLLADNKKQLEIGTMAPLDVVNAESSVAADQQALISSQSALNYQQQIIKQAIARNLNDAALSAAPVIPTDRVSLEAIPEETQPVEALVQEAFQRRPELEQAVLTLRNDEITLKGARNALLPTLDAYGFYGSSALGGAQSKTQSTSWHLLGTSSTCVCTSGEHTASAMPERSRQSVTARWRRTSSTAPRPTRAWDSISPSPSATAMRSRCRSAR